MKKKLILAAAAVLLSAQAALADGFDAVFKTFKKKEGVEYVSVPKFLLLLATPKMTNGEGMPGKVSGLKVLDASGAEATMRTNLANAVANAAAADPKIEELMRVSDSGEKVRMWGTGDKDHIKQLYIYAEDGKDCSFIALSGKFRRSDVGSMAPKKKQ